MNEYLVEALKESHNGERTDKFTEHIFCEASEIEERALECVKCHHAERFNVWMKVKI